MKKGLKIFLGILLILLLGIGWVTYTNWNTIMALVDSFRYSQEELAEKVENEKLELQEYIDKNEDIVVRDLTEEESKALSEGNLTEDEVISLLTGQTPAPQPTEEPTKPPVTSAPPQPAISTQPQPATANPTIEPTPVPTKSSGQIVSELIAKLYVQKSKYLGKLDVIEAQAYAEFYGIHPSKRDGNEWELKQEFLSKYLPTVSAWEKECDSVVYGVIDEIRAELKKSGQDTKVVDQLTEAYLNEKSAKKTYFINRYMD